MEEIAGDNVTLERRNALQQFSDFLAIERGNEIVPLVVDRINSIDGRGCIQSDRVILTTNPQFQNYVFPVKSFSKKEMVYLLIDDYGVRLRKLPECLGDGFYDAFVDEHVAMNTSYDGVGGVNVTAFRTGIPYILPDEGLVGE